MADSIYKPVFRLEPGDGTGYSLADAAARNAISLCAVLDCAQSLSGGKRYMFGVLCQSHAAVQDEMLRKLIEDDHG